MAKTAGLKYVQIPMTTRVVPTAQEIAAFMKTVTDPESQPVYVHCVGGRHRTGVMTAIYRMTFSNWSGAQAFKEMKQYKFGADFLHPEFKAFVLGYPAMIAANGSAPRRWLLHPIRSRSSSPLEGSRFPALRQSRRRASIGSTREARRRAPRRTAAPPRPASLKHPHRSPDPRSTLRTRAPTESC